MSHLPRVGLQLLLLARVLGGLCGFIVLLMCLAGNVMVAQSQTEALRGDPRTFQVAALFFLGLHFLAGIWLRAALVPRSLGWILCGWFGLQVIVLLAWIGIYWVTTHEPPWGIRPEDTRPALRSLCIMNVAAMLGSLPTACGYQVSGAIRRKFFRSRRMTITRRRNQPRTTP